MYQPHPLALSLSLRHQYPDNNPFPLQPTSPTIRAEAPTAVPQKSDVTMCQLQLRYKHVTNVTALRYKKLNRRYERCDIPATNCTAGVNTPATEAVTILCPRSATTPATPMPPHSAERLHTGFRYNPDTNVVRFAGDSHTKNFAANTNRLQLQIRSVQPSVNTSDTQANKICNGTCTSDTQANKMCSGTCTSVVPEGARRSQR